MRSEATGEGSERAANAASCLVCDERSELQKVTYC